MDEEEEEEEEAEHIKPVPTVSPTVRTGNDLSIEIDDLSEEEEDGIFAPPRPAVGTNLSKTSSFGTPDPIGMSDLSAGEENERELHNDGAKGSPPERKPCDGPTLKISSVSVEKQEVEEEEDAAEPPGPRAERSPTGRNEDSFSVSHATEAREPDPPKPRSPAESSVAGRDGKGESGELRSSMPGHGDSVLDGSPRGPNAASGESASREMGSSTIEALIATDDDDGFGTESEVKMIDPASGLSVTEGEGESAFEIESLLQGIDGLSDGGPEDGGADHGDLLRMMIDEMGFGRLEVQGQIAVAFEMADALLRQSVFDILGIMDG
jgi:hypothetical protein